LQSAAPFLMVSADCKSYDIAQDMKRVFNDKNYKKLIEHSFYYAHP
jgi:hypothetical protein